jgi:uncharacterized protein DUF4154
MESGLRVRFTPRLAGLFDASTGMTPRRSKWWRTTARVGGLLLGLLAFSGAPAASNTYSEDAVKAAFLSRFAEFVEWPPDAPAAQNFTIAVLGADAVASDLERLLPGSRIKGLPAQVRRIRGVQDLGDCQLMFLGADQGDALRAIVAKLAARAVLLVTDQQKSIDAGGIVNFVLVDNRVRFEVSLPAAQRSRLRVSSELLSVALRVQTGHQVSSAVWLDGAAAAPGAGSQ